MSTPQAKPQNADDAITLTSDELLAIQAKAFDILKWFLDYCAKHELRVWLYAGTLLGAVRHKGYIPWDDDIDVLMPRPDYDRLVSLWPSTNNDHYSFVTTTRDLVTHDPIGVICDNDTTAIKTQHVDVDMPQGLEIDIFPLDACPATRLGQHLQMAWNLMFGVFIAQFAPDTHGRLAELAAKIALATFRPAGLRWRLWRFAERRMLATPYGSTKWVRTLYSGPVNARKIVPLADFDSTVRGEFCGLDVPLPRGWDDFLTRHFGDWRELPPLQDRVPHHDMAFLDLNTPYLRYKGVRYCVPGPPGGPAG